jgi:hypothetical protein
MVVRRRRLHIAAQVDLGVEIEASSTHGWIREIANAVSTSSAAYASPTPPLTESICSRPPPPRPHPFDSTEAVDGVLHRRPRSRWSGRGPRRPRSESQAVLPAVPPFRLPPTGGTIRSSPETARVARPDAPASSTLQAQRRSDHPSLIDVRGGVRRLLDAVLSVWQPWNQFWRTRNQFWRSEYVGLRMRRK